MKARKVKGLDPAGALADNAERIVRTRLAEVADLLAEAGDPAAVTALHDLRIAAKRLRYVLELTHPCFGPYAQSSIKRVKELQDLLGEIHDADVQIPDVVGVLNALVAEDAVAVAEAARGDEDLSPAAAAHSPHAADWAGLVTVALHLQARRHLLFGRFLALRRDMERKGFRARLEYAAAERPASTSDSLTTPPAPGIMPVQ
jgi:CHAD domain-containing protein